MAQIAATMNSLGHETPCQGCNTAWERGQAMTAVETNMGEPMGWFCSNCIKDWPPGKRSNATAERQHENSVPE